MYPTARNQQQIVRGGPILNALEIVLSRGHDCCEDFGSEIDCFVVYIQRNKLVILVLTYEGTYLVILINCIILDIESIYGSDPISQDPISPLIMLWFDNARF